ncbi:MAG: shikimate dehydrogenase family protein [Flavobacteriia bacterium]|jgi:shikimate dehydrogenase
MPKFGLIGKRLDYSFSKTFFSDYFEKNNLTHSYENIEIPDISEIKQILENGNFNGLNVTIPYKESIITYLDELSPEAKAIGAVNTVSFINGKTIGHNTDAFGFQQSIKPFLDNRHERAMILGTGGASKAIAYVLKQIGLNVIFISRNPQAEDQFSYSEINENMVNACKMIVNCTPIGTFPNVTEKPDFPTEFLTQNHFVVDLIYNPEKTMLLKEAEAKGAMILNGYSMLKEQALKAWDIWAK